MEKLKMLSRIKELYLDNVNITQYLKNLDERECNSVEDILISYDFQAGTYFANYFKSPEFRNKLSASLAKVIDNLGEYNSLLEAGIGEATTLGPLLLSLETRPGKCYGFDISWSRVKWARNFLRELKLDGVVELFTADLFCTPIQANSIDIVYTCHSIEPNGGREEEALIELYRIANKYLILLEPAYEFANEEARARMISNGYITRLFSTAKNLGFNIIEHRLFDIYNNNLNPTGIIIIKKDESKAVEPLCCPLTKTKLVKKHNAYYSEESLLAYPILDDIPCLLSQNAIIATKFLE